VILFYIAVYQHSVAVATTATETCLHRHVYASLDESLGCWAIQYSTTQHSTAQYRDSIEVPFAAARERVASLQAAGIDTRLRRNTVLLYSRMVYHPIAAIITDLSQIIINYIVQFGDHGGIDGSSSRCQHFCVVRG